MKTGHPSDLCNSRRKLNQVNGRHAMHNEGIETGRKNEFGSFEIISIDKIASEGYLRQIIDESALQALAKNIENHGVRRPILVKQLDESGESYQLLAGKRRLEACISLGWQQIPAIIFKGVEIESVTESLIDNLTHKKFTCIELAIGFNKLVSTGMSRIEICSTFQVPKSSLSELLRIATIDNDILEKCIKNKHTTRRFLTKLSKFSKNDIVDAYQYFCEHGVLPDEHNVNKTLSRIMRTAEKLIHDLRELTTSCPEEDAMKLDILIDEAHLNIGTVVMITSTYY